MAVNKLDITMMEDVGTSANQLLQRDGSGNIPAVDGSQVAGVTEFTTSTSDPAIDTNPSGGVGSLWYNKTSGEMYVCTDATAGENVWKNVGAGTGNVFPAKWYGPRGLSAGGYGGPPAYKNIIDYWTIATTGNAVDFGDLVVTIIENAGVAGGGRGMFFGGYRTGLGNSPTIEYVTITTPGNSIDFGDLTQAGMMPAGVSNGFRAVRGGLTIEPSYSTHNVMDYWTIATPGNAVDFGDLTITKSGSGGIGNETRGLYMGGHTANALGTQTNVIDYITIATTGNAYDFGDMTEAKTKMGSCSSETRGVRGGGYPSTNVIDYVTVATTGNAIDFGDLTISRNALGAGDISNGTRGNFIGGQPGPSSHGYDTIDYITIATTGNATDFGDLTDGRGVLAGCAG